MPEHRCSRELQSLGVSRHVHAWNGTSPLPTCNTALDNIGIGRDALARTSTCVGLNPPFRGPHTGTARTRARAPALSFMLARATMQMPINKEDVNQGRRHGEI